MPYDQIVGQMVLMGLGLGLTTAPATESVLSVLPPAKAGVGSAVNDATREAGGTLGVAVLGSIFTSLYARHLATTAFDRLPNHVVTAAQNSVASAMTTVSQAHGSAAQQQLLAGVHASFMNGFHVACIVAAGCRRNGRFGLRATGLTARPGPPRSRTRNGNYRRAAP